MDERNHRRQRPLLKMASQALLFASLAFGEPAVLTQLKIVAGERGIALALEADKPFQAAFSVAKSSSSGSLVKATLSNAVYGLGEYTYDDFAGDAPVAKITASNGATDAVEMTVELRVRVGGPVQTKQKGRRVLALLSSVPQKAFAWATPTREVENAETGAGSGTQRQPANRGAPAALSEIRVLRRDRVEELVIQTDKPVQASARRRGNTITVMFEGAVSRLEQNTFRPGKGSAFDEIQVQENRRDNTQMAAVTVRMTAVPEGSALVRTTRTGVAVCVARDAPGKMAYWSAAEGAALSVEFVDLPVPSVDSGGMAARAEEDLDREVSRKETFAVSEEEKENTPVEAVGAEPAVRKVDREPAETAAAPSAERETRTGGVPARLVVVRDDVNLRAAPTTEENNVLTVLSIGTKGTAAGEDGQWHRLRTDAGAEGWIYATMVAESSRVTDRQWAAIEEAHGEEVSREAANLTEVQAPAADPDAAASPTDPSDEEESVSLPKEPAVFYRVQGRDPFLPLDQLESDDAELPDVEAAELVGIMYDEKDRLALLEDGRNGNAAFALRERDPIQRGRVLKILPKKVVFLLDEDGIAHTYSLFLENDGKLRGK